MRTTSRHASNKHIDQALHMCVITTHSGRLRPRTLCSPLRLPGVIEPRGSLCWSACCGISSLRLSLTYIQVKSHASTDSLQMPHCLVGRFHAAMSPYR